MKTADQITLSREQLYDLVWAEPMTKVAARFQISDVGLKKRCLKDRIPVPGRGYWRKIETGKKVPKQPALPKVSNASPITFLIFEKAREAEPMSTIDPAFVEYEAAHPILIADELQRPSPEAKAVLRDLRGQKPDEYGAIKSRQPDTFQVRIHPSSKDRVILLIDALAKACRDRGFTFADGRPGSRYWEHLSVVVDGISLYPVFEERMHRTSYRMTEEQLARQRRGHHVYTPSYSYEPSGEVTLKIEGASGGGLQTSWKDTRHQKIEPRLNEVIIGLRMLAAHKAAEQRKADDRNRRHEVIQQKRADLRARMATERHAVEALEADANAWERAKRLRGYIKEVETRAIEAGTIGSEAAWVSWAREQADRIDPLRTSPLSILDTPEEEYRAFSIWQMPDEE